MDKKQILEKLNAQKLDKKQILIISGASLVVQGVIEQTGDIDIATTTKYYNQLDWPEKVGAMGANIKYIDCFEISDHLLKEDFVEINGFRFMTLEDCLELKKLLNREKDQPVIEKLEKLLK